MRHRCLEMKEREISCPPGAGITLLCVCECVAWVGKEIKLRTKNRKRMRSWLVRPTRSSSAFVTRASVNSNPALVLAQPCALGGGTGTPSRVGGHTSTSHACGVPSHVRQAVSCPSSQQVVDSGSDESYTCSA